MKPTSETEKQGNLPIEARWPHKREQRPNVLGQLCMCRQSFFLAAHLNMKLMNFRWLDWLRCLRCECVVGPACTSQQTGSRTLPHRACKPPCPATTPAEICTQTGGVWWASTFSWNGFGARRGATGKGSCCWTRSLLTHRSWQGYRWPTSPSVQHH